MNIKSSIKKSKKKIQLKWFVLFIAVMSSLFFVGCGQDGVIFTGSTEAGDGGISTFEENGSLAEETNLGHNEVNNGSMETNAEMCYVHIEGQVKYPGVYEVEVGSRLFQVVELAGGFTKDADEQYCNLASQVCDGMQYYIPSLQETAELAQNGALWVNVASGQTSQESHYLNDGRLDINLATLEELCGLTGIGETRANAILTYRQENGSFSKVEDIMNVPGIKEGTFARFASEIGVRER